jgi:ribosomal protein L7/L12
MRKRRRAAIEKKLRRIISPMFETDNLVHNLSEKDLTEDQYAVLRHEANFNVSDAKPIRFIAEFESILAQSSATEDQAIQFGIKYPR